MLKLEEIYDVTVAKDGQEAYEKVKDSMDEGTQFNLIFMDIQVLILGSIQCRFLTGTDAESRWLTKYSADTPNGVLCANCCIVQLFRKKVMSRSAWILAWICSSASLSDVLPSSKFSRSFGTILEEPEPWHIAT